MATPSARGLGPLRSPTLVTALMVVLMLASTSRPSDAQNGPAVVKSPPQSSPSIAGLARPLLPDGDTATPQMTLDSEIGGLLENGRAAFGRIADVSLSPDGSRLSVLDSERCTILIFGRQGASFRRISTVQGCDEPGTFSQPTHLADDGTRVWVWDTGRSGLIGFSPGGQLESELFVVEPDDSGADYLPAQIHFSSVGDDERETPVLEWELVLVSGAEEGYPQVLLSLPDGSSPGWLAAITAGATMPDSRYGGGAFSHGIESCVSPDGERFVLQGRGTRRIEVREKASMRLATRWPMTLEPREGVNLNSTQVGCLRDFVMIRTRVYDETRSEFTSGRDHYFGYDGAPLGSRRLKSEYGIRELGKVLDAKGSLFVTASNLRFPHPTVFVWRVTRQTGERDGGGA